ncbi:MAG: peptidyl-alpha-hydroxyglycine alpha-amidating lyase family protein [Chloroflexota bacterium]
MSVKPATPLTKYEPVPLWGHVPHGIWLYEATSVAVDNNDRVYVFNRGNHPMVVLDTEGEFVESWGQGQFNRPHGVTVAPDGNLFLADDLDHTVRKTDTRGKTIFTLGSSGKPAAWQGGEPFNRPTHVAVSERTGEFFVSDGYGNSRVHKFDPDGKHMKSWGEPGDRAGQFSLPHNIAMLGDDHVIVCDRENFRLQIFTTEGEYVDQWHAHRPIAIRAGKGDDTNIYVAEAGPPPVQKDVPNLGMKVSVLTRDGKEILRFGDSLPGEGPSQFLAPHGMDIDSQGNVYIAEVSKTSLGNNGITLNHEPVSLRKWRRVSG